jgi:hypothetical protein
MSLPIPDSEIWPPPYDEIEDAPQLAFLASIRTAIELVEHTMTIAHPEISEGVRYAHEAPARAANRVLADAACLHRSIEEYREVLVEQDRKNRSDEPDDIAF